MTRRDVDRWDIQALARTGFGTLTGATYLMLRVVDAAAARQWLGSLDITSLAGLRPAGVKTEVLLAKQVAMTAAGLRALGVDGHIVGGFAPEFVEGMTGSPNRSQRLGDTGANAPEHWRWGLGEREPHVLLMLFATPERIGDLEREERARAEAQGLSVIEPLHTADMGDIEPFGFADGVSQPSFDWDRARTPGTKADRAYTNALALGEILLGYGNEYGFPADSPTIAASEPNASLLPAALAPADSRDLGRNGSYLVFREMAQDVLGFWRWAAKETERVGGTVEALAETMVGRRMSGAPLVDFETGLDLPGVDPDDRGRNGFLFDSDPDGLSCPIGAHVRRANPRTGDVPAAAEGPIDTLLATVGLTRRQHGSPTSSTLPWEANNTVWPYLRNEDDAIASARFHRVLRRGREFGTKIDVKTALDPTTTDPQSGLHFLCLNANIGRQFEFIQGAWLASAKFAGLTGEQDPLLGNREPFPVPPICPVAKATDGFTRPGSEPALRQSNGIPQFVTVRGGAYFFLPGLAALRWIASL
jgi:deferrochelatase/peroxidase EfeB